MNDTLLEQDELDEGLDDIELTPTKAKVDRLKEKEGAILFDKPLYRFLLPNKREVEIYAKTEGQMGLIDKAFQAWVDARLRGHRRTGKRWRLWFRRRRNVEREMDHIQECKFEFFRTIFEDRYVEDRHVEFAAEDFLSMDKPTAQAILQAYKDANDGGDLLEEMITDNPKDPKQNVKKNAILRAAKLDGMHI